MCISFIGTLWIQKCIISLFILFHKMLIISYDIADDKLRTKFSKFIRKYGRRIQYSVYEIRNSDRVIDIIKAEIDHIFEPKFSVADTILIIPISLADEKKLIKYGWGANDDLDFILVE